MLALFITLSELQNFIEIITCFLERSLIVILSFGLSFWFKLFITLWISETLSAESFKKISFIFIISLTFPLDTWVYDSFFNCLFQDKTWFSLKNFDFSRTFLLGLGEIDEGTFKILACLFFGNMLWFETIKDLESLWLNCAKMYCLKDLWFLLAVNLSHPAL